MRPHELTAQGLATEFLGRRIARWTCKQLRTFVEAFSKPDARILKARDSKLNVCAKLFSLRPRGRLTHGDWAALYLLLNAEGQAEGLYLEQARALAQRGALKFSPSRPPGTRECQVCTEDLPESAFPRQMNTPSAGSHSRFDTCKDCFKAPIEACGLSTALDEIPCPEAECECVIDYVFMKAFAPDSVFERYDSLLREKACGAEYVSCANEDCDQGGTVDLPFTSFITCQYETRTCTTCKTAWHPHITHDENMAEVHRQAEEAERRRRNGEKVSEEHRSTTFIAGNTKACPGRRCGARVEKNGGCDHMVRFTLSKMAFLLDLD